MSYNAELLFFLIPTVPIGGPYLFYQGKVDAHAFEFTVMVVDREDLLIVYLMIFVGVGPVKGRDFKKGVLGTDENGDVIVEIREDKEEEHKGKECRDQDSHGNEENVRKDRGKKTGKK